MSNRLQVKTPEVTEALLAATGELLQRFGYSKVSVEEIAQQAGVSRATAYLYYKNKEALAMGWLEERGAQRLAELREVAARHPEPRERVRALLRARVHLSLDRLKNWGEHLDELLHALKTPLRRWREHMLEQESELVAVALEQADWSSQPQSDARLLCLAAQGPMFAPYLGALHEVDPDLIRAQAERLIEWLLRGLAR